MLEEYIGVGDVHKESNIFRAIPVAGQLMWINPTIRLWHRENTLLPVGLETVPLNMAQFISSCAAIAFRWTCHFDYNIGLQVHEQVRLDGSSSRQDILPRISDVTGLIHHIFHQHTWLLLEDEEPTQDGDCSCHS